MTVLEIVAEWLKEHGYDGLYQEGECSCLLDDLFPCGGEYCHDCLAGYQSKKSDEEYTFYVGPNKEG